MLAVFTNFVLMAIFEDPYGTNHAQEEAENIQINCLTNLQKIEKVYEQSVTSQMVFREQLDSVLSAILAEQKSKNYDMHDSQEFRTWVSGGNTQLLTDLNTIFVVEKDPWVTTQQLWYNLGEILKVR